MQCNCSVLQIVTYQLYLLCYCSMRSTYSKTCVKRPLSKRPNIGFQDQLSLNAGRKYCRMLQGEHLQYFQPSLSYHLCLRHLLCLFFELTFYTVFTVYHITHSRHVLAPTHLSDIVSVHISSTRKANALEFFYAAD